MSTEIVDAARWPLAFNRETSGGGEWAVEGEELANGVWVANLSQADELGRWSVRVERTTTADLALLRDFFRWMRGPFRAFRFPDPMDHTTAALPFGTPTALDQSLGTGDGATAVFKLRVARTIQSFTYTRRIWRPRAETVLIAADGVPVDPAAYTLDPATGTVTFDTPPADEAVLTWGGDYDKAARFTALSLDLRPGGVTTGDAATIELREVRETVA